MLNCVTTVPKRASILCASNQRSSTSWSFFRFASFSRKKPFRKDPTLVRRQCFRTDQRDGAALVVFANSFACTRSSYTRTNDEIIAPNHIETRTIISAEVRRQAKSLRDQKYV